eukprot:5527156-Amphidinium_carterae.1
MNRQLLIQLLLSDTSKDDPDLKAARRSVFRLIVGAATLTKKKARGKKLLLEFSKKVAKTNEELSSLAAAAAELVPKFPAKASTRESVIPSWASISSAVPELACFYYAHSLQLSNQWRLVNARMVPEYFCRSEWLQLRFDTASLQLLRECDKVFWTEVVSKSGVPAGQDPRIADQKCRDLYLFPTEVNLLQILDRPKTNMSVPGPDPSLRAPAANASQQELDQYESDIKDYRIAVELYKEAVHDAVRNLFSTNHPMYAAYQKSFGVGGKIDFCPIVNETGIFIYEEEDVQDFEQVGSSAPARRAASKPKAQPKSKAQPKPEDASGATHSIYCHAQRLIQFTHITRKLHCSACRLG